MIESTGVASLTVVEGGTILDAQSGAVNMGIDIEAFAEVFDGERWVVGEPLVEYEYYGPEDEPPVSRLRPRGLYESRNRALFAILADAVRWAHSEQPYEPIAPCRGLPGDVSPEVLDFERSWHEDNFGHSWLGLEELIRFDWKGRIIQKTAMVDPEAAPLFEGNPLGFPYHGWPEGRQISYAEASRSGVRVRWRETYEESAGRFFLEGVLTKLQSFGPPGSVRIVFWFNA